MDKKSIKFLLVQINEAHSSAWPAGLSDQPEPQKCYNDRVCRATEFIEEDNPKESFVIRVDGWNDLFDNTFRAWPDRYYLINKQYKVLAKSEYGMKKDGLINIDCLDLLNNMLKN